MNWYWIGCAFLLLVICLRVLGRITRARKRRARRPPLARVRSPFDAAAWPRGGPVAGGRHRPADIVLNDTQILPPPREIRGKYGE
jgi:hypothetical protein